jgi:hypothetical protein
LKKNHVELNRKRDFNFEPLEKSQNRTEAVTTQRLLKRDPNNKKRTGKRHQRSEEESGGVKIIKNICPEA